jgi:hypothetical protein
MCYTCIGSCCCLGFDCLVCVHLVYMHYTSVLISLPMVVIVAGSAS